MNELTTIPLFKRIVNLIESSRKQITTSVNSAMVNTYYEIGRYIVEDEQNGAARAEYGKGIIKSLSAQLTEKFGKGWTIDNLKRMRQFYLVYSKTGISDSPISTLSLSWSHYLVLMRIENVDERHFYEIETAKQQWSVRQLQRQYASSLYERLALSRDKDTVMRLANEGLVLESPKDILRQPVTLEFFGLKTEAAYSESDLESAILTKIQDFLLELGKGFLFEARQKRFSFDERNYYVDLVLYNRLLQCYVLIDLKIDDLSHQDLGQMQMYVNYYDRYVKTDFEKPSIGILLCKSKNDALVELTLPQDANIYAQQYALCLPDKALLQQNLREWLSELNG